MEVRAFLEDELERAEAAAAAARRVRGEVEAELAGRAEQQPPPPHQQQQQPQRKELS